MKNRIITVSREFGSGGRTIGKQVAKELGIPCYDNELIQKIASESGFDEHYVKDAGEYDSGGFPLDFFQPCVRRYKRGPYLESSVQNNTSACGKRAVRYRGQVRGLYPAR